MTASRVANQSRWPFCFPELCMPRQRPAARPPVCAQNVGRQGRGHRADAAVTVLIAGPIAMPHITCPGSPHQQHPNPKTPPAHRHPRGREWPETTETGLLPLPHPFAGRIPRWPHRKIRRFEEEACFSRPSAPLLLRMYWMTVDRLAGHRPCRHDGRRKQMTPPACAFYERMATLRTVPAARRRTPGRRSDRPVLLRMTPTNVLRL